MQQRLKRYGDAAGIRGVRVSPHTLRHTYALNFVRNGGDPFRLQKVLGHSSLDTTRRYCELSESDVMEGQRQLTPLRTMDLGFAPRDASRGQELVSMCRLPKRLLLMRSLLAKPFGELSVRRLAPDQYVKGPDPRDPDPLLFSEPATQFINLPLTSQQILAHELHDLHSLFPVSRGRQQRAAV